MSCGVVPARHIVLSSPIRGLRPRLLSLRSVLPSRQIVLNEIFCPRIARIFVQASAKPNLFELCRAQPKMSKKLARMVAMDKMATGSVALIYTNARRGMSCGVVPSRHIVFGSPIRALRTRLPSLRSVVPSRHLTPKPINAFVIKTTTGTP